MTKFGSLVSAPCAAIPELAFYLRCVSQSGVEQGHTEAEFPEKGPKVLIILG